HMLRIFKPRSPMSVGSWGLVFFGGFATISVFLQAARDGLFDWFQPFAWLGRAGRGTLWAKPFEAVGAWFGLFMGGYTGVLISNTAVPLWARNYKTNGPVFLSSALATAAAAVSLLLALTGRAPHASERKLAIVQGGATWAEGALLAYELHHLGPLREPLTKGKSAPFFYLSALCGLVLPTLIGIPTHRGLKIIKALLTLAGGFLLRAALVLGGKESGQDPQAYFWFTDPRR
ncbi:MAG: NrfD/PsrC family molybdoenzyme membrane anchor subunit, partial [Ardenticatenaceae bacterium]